MKKCSYTQLALLLFSYISMPLLYATPSFSELETKYKCELITKGFSDKDIIKLNTKDYVVAWCDTKPNNENPEYSLNLLISYKNKNHDFASCPNFIETWRMSVLSILGEKKPVTLYEGIATLDKFWEVNSNPDSALSNLKGIKATAAGLHIGWWDAGQVLYCYKGKWLMGGFH